MILTRPPALQKQGITIPAFHKRDWETLPSPYNELQELRQTQQTQLCPRPWNTAGLAAAPLTLFKQWKDFLSDTFWINDISSVNTQLAPLKAQPSCHYCRTWGARKKASSLLLSHLPPAAEDLHTPSINACNLETALASAFISTHQEAAVLSGGAISVYRSRAKETPRSTSSSSAEPSQLLKALEAQRGTLLAQRSNLDQIRIILFKFSDSSTKHLDF